MPYADVPKDSICFKPCQRIGATGILKGKGVSIDWHNKTLFRPDAVVAWNDIAGLAEVYPFAAKLLRHGEEASYVETNGQSVDGQSVGEALSVDALSVGDALLLVSAIAKQEKRYTISMGQAKLSNFNCINLGGKKKPHILT